LADNLIQKKGESTWYVRLAIPVDVQRVFGGRKVLIQSLQTGLRSEAMTKRLQHLACWKQQIIDARQARSLPENWQSAVIDELQGVDDRSRDFKLQLVGLGAPTSPEALSLVAIAQADPAVMASMREFVKRNSTQGGHAGALQLGEAIQDGFKQAVSAQLLARHSLTSDQRAELTALTAQPSSYKPRSPITQKKLLAFQDFLEAQGKDLKTADVMVRKVELFSQWLNETGYPLTFDTVSDYLTKLSDSNGTSLASKTKKQHLWACSAFWKWAGKYDHDWRVTYKGQPSPFKEHELPVIKGEAISWSAFTRTEVEHLHAKALEKSDQTLANLIAIAAYTGCRLEELGSLHRDSLTLENGTPVSLKIAESKTEAGIRAVPVHPKLAPMIIELLNTSADGYLIEGRKLDEANRYGHRLDAVGKRFGRLKTANQFGRQYVFHSIRKTAITLTHQAGGDIAVMPALFGHETGLITLDIYSEGPSMAQKRKVIELLEYDFYTGQNSEKP
jgi:integrase